MHSLRTPGIVCCGFEGGVGRCPRGGVLAMGFKEWAKCKGLAWLAFAELWACGSESPSPCCWPMQSKAVDSCHALLQTGPLEGPLFGPSSGPVCSKGERVGTRPKRHAP